MKKILTLICIVFLCINAMYAQSNNDKARAYFNQAKNAYSSSNYAQTIEYLNSAEQLLGSTNPVILNLKVKAYYNLEQYDDAKKSLAQFSKVSAKADSGLVDETVAYIVKIDDAIAEEKANKEQARLAKIQRKEDERLAEIKRKEDTRLAEIKRKEDARLAEIKRKEDELLAEKKKLLYRKEMFQEVKRIKEDLELLGRTEPYKGCCEDHIYWNSNGEIELTIPYDSKIFGNVETDFGYFYTNSNEGYAIVESISWIKTELGYDKEGKMGLINKDGELIFPYKFNSVGEVSDGLVRVGNKTIIINRKKRSRSVEMKLGYSDLKGNIVIPLQYPYASKFENGKARVSLNGRKWFYINKNGEKIKN